MTKKQRPPMPHVRGPEPVPFPAHDFAVLARLKGKGAVCCGLCDAFDIHAPINDHIAYCHRRMLWTAIWDPDCGQFAPRPVVEP